MTDFADVGAAEERERSVPPPSGTRFPKQPPVPGGQSTSGSLCAHLAPLLRCAVRGGRAAARPALFYTLRWIGDGVALLRSAERFPHTDALCVHLA